MSRVRYCLRFVIIAAMCVTLLIGCTNANATVTKTYGDIQTKDRAKILQDVYGKIPIPADVYSR